MPYIMCKIVDQFRMTVNPCDLAMLRAATTRINIKRHHFFCRLTYDDVQRLVVESKATNVRSDGTPFLAMILCSKRFDPEKENEKHTELIT